MAAATMTAHHVDDLIASDLSSQDNDDEARASFDREDDDLPELPIDEHSLLNEDSALDYYRHQDPSDPHHPEHFDERQMRKHFMDVESSFLPDVAPAPFAQQHDGTAGVDDTYLELGKPGHTPPPDEMFASLSGRRASAKYLRTSKSDSPSDVHQMSIPPEEQREEQEDDADYSGATWSSPAAAAFRRTHDRNASTGSSGKKAQNNSRPTTPASQRPTSKGSTIRAGSAKTSRDATPKEAGDEAAQDSSSTPARFAARRAFLKSRHASQSSISSRGTESDLSGSDAAVNADYALQAGGAMPAESLLGRSRRDHMARLPSFGSLGSLTEPETDSAPSTHRGIGVTPNLGGFRGGRLNDDRPETPRASNGRVEFPTDTVIAQHVQNIHVPDTIARDFRAMNPSFSPNKQQRPLSSGGAGSNLAQGGPRRTLTLKEQNSKIDKLSKENFDLKLKIHFLDQALQSRSDEGVKEMIDKNVQLQTDLANERKDSQALRRKMRELEQRVKEQEEALAQAQQQKRSREEEEEDDPTLQAEMHEEILYLRQQLDHSENRVTTLTEDVMTKELEKRKMAEHMRSMAGHRGQDTAGMKEAMEMWQDLLNAETGRREQAEDDLRKLREELSALRVERASPSFTRTIGKRRSLYDDSQAAESEYSNGANGTTGRSSATLVEQLKHENAELRRDLGAQTSMLTSRNRERERLQQEIEDLKLLQRKSDGARSIAGDSIFDRSISRAHQRAASRASEAQTQVTDTERDDWERKEGQLRDQNAELRLKFQELERTHSTHLRYVSVLEGDFQQMETELNESAEDLRALQTERDEALTAFQEKESELEKLEREALAEIEKLEKEADGLQTQLQEAQKRQQRTQTRLEHTTDGYKGLQGELREITQSVLNLEHEKQANLRTIETLEQQLAETEEELQKWEAKCKEIDQKNRKLEITQESLHSEITFLREEQEGDKIKIGELEDALNAAQQSIQDEQEKLREMEEGIVEERQQRDVLENKSKDEVQKVLDGLNAESQKTKDEVRKLRRGLSAKEVEASSWKQKLEELEQSLRDVLGDPEGTKSSLLAEIEKLQRDIETTASSLDRTKMDLADKERLLRHRDGLLESTSLESRRLSDLLDKERASRRHDLEQFERSSRGQATHLRTIAQQESRVLELEEQYTQDRRRMAALDEQYRDQLTERNALLFALWNRLSTLCGADWAQNHSLVDGEVPSVDVIARRLPAFNKNLISAVKTVEGLIGSFKGRIRGIEKDLWKDYQTLEHNLEMRIRRMDALESTVKDTQRVLADAAAESEAEQQQRPPVSRGSSFRGTRSNEELGKLRSELKVLKAELRLHRQHPSAMAQQVLHQQSQQVMGAAEQARRLSTSASGKTAQSPARAIMSSLLRHHSSSSSAVVEQQQQQRHLEPADEGAEQQQQHVVHQPSAFPHSHSEQRWVHRLKELERRLKAEREARLLDRKGARQRLEEGRLENEELRSMLEREKARREMMLGEGEEGRSLGGARSSAETGRARREYEEEDGQASSGVD
ncbi:hypothetical protein BDY17DRAFT_311512 [Neohortaea acidophila]|uniref:Anucleate primary sterigmata protein B n=1 Tax=Neohortaea acidophila TaxID=245834 RepID=A0A6A6PP50_9PEZI|nr:uncharacterized protein BDY17DRAFT_311512 [Neohortaea acidophila]KAF2481880.1 hypothetical protein BDY17DRAFT_311512 [Neohortaea acidophila]